MQFSNPLINNLGPLAAYGEYSEETASQSTQAKKKLFVPVNHLAQELSPYLKKHSSNPVGWYPWGQEAFNVALREDRPLFVSIGFSSDHWCSVMERDCFSDNEVAGLLNDTCIPVCVDREERPDIDALFMEICRVQNGSAGWPLNIFMTPEARPFFCTTWLPKRTIGQMPGITELLPRVKWLWLMQREDVERAASDLAELVKDRLQLLAGLKHRGGRIGKIKAFEALNDIRSIFDVRWGGFGPAPKFPEPTKLLFLLKLAEDSSGASKRDKSDALTMVDITLRRMWRGGIHDHLGGGFSRYSVDDKWLVPHFEKLLCDQALLLLTASKAQTLQDNSFHRLFAEDIIFCVTRDFSDNSSYSQGFRTSIDGDTQDGEGRYYLWTEDEIKKVLPEGDTGLFCAAYAVLPSGNFGAEVAGAQMGQNILYEASTVTELAKRYSIKGAEVGRKLYQARKLLLDFRDNRYPLRTDNKILMSWNGLMIGALASAAVAFNQPEWKDFAERAALFIHKNFCDKLGSWHHSWIDGKLGVLAFSEDYSYFLWGLVNLYKALLHFGAGDKQLGDWLKAIQGLADNMIAHLWDKNLGALFMTNSNDFPSLQPFMFAFDCNSLPSPNACASIALSELATILEDKIYSDYARKIIDRFSRLAATNPLNYLSILLADLLWVPVKKKPEPIPVPVPTDEELNREEAQPSQEQVHSPHEERKTSRIRAHSRSDRAEKRRVSRSNRSRT